MSATVFSRATLQPFFEDACNAEIVKQRGRSLGLLVYPAEGDPYQVVYQADNGEFDQAAENDWVLFWPALPINAGLPYAMPSQPYAPDARQQRMAWDNIDRTAYELDPIPVG